MAEAHLVADCATEPEQVSGRRLRKILARREHKAAAAVAAAAHQPALSQPAPFCFHLGLRHVPPYLFMHTVAAKPRWVGRTVADVFATEFVSLPVQYFRDAIAAGRIRLASGRVGGDYVIRPHDQILHEQHRHEPPVLDTPINIWCGTCCP